MQDVALFCRVFFYKKQLFCIFVFCKKLDYDHFYKYVKSDGSISAVGISDGGSVACLRTG